MIEDKMQSKDEVNVGLDSVPKAQKYVLKISYDYTDKVLLGDLLAIQVETYIAAHFGKYTESASNEIRIVVQKEKN